MSYPAPRVSVLIPNYNNGKASSHDGQTDLIGDLLQSLHDTLHDDPTPLEIIAYDDGSDDDSLDTLRLWSKKTWRDGQPFIVLIEAEHTGILSIGANRLVRESQGEFLARLDGDTQMLTRHWATKLCQTFDQAPARLGVVGPKQLRPDGKIHAFGDWLLHPKGYHHIAVGADPALINQAMEVDHVMGCFYCCKRKVYDEVGGYDENILRGQTIDFGLNARLKGWACWAIPQIEYIHRHGLRGARKTEADTQEGIKKTLDVFEQKWGFDRLSPDLDFVRKKFAGTPLLWNAEVFGTLPPGLEQASSADTASLPIEQSVWTRYGTDEKFKQLTDTNIHITLQVVAQTIKPQKVAVIGCDAGLTTHLLAGQGLNCIATNTDLAKIDLAEKCIGTQVYPADKPQFLHQKHPSRLPLTDGSVDMALLFNQIEQHHNPIALLRESKRILKPGGILVIVTKRQHQARNMQEYNRCYHVNELMAQVNATGGYQPISDPRQGDPTHPLFILLKRTAPAANKPNPAEAA